jgi:hypothetical protein
MKRTIIGSAALYVALTQVWFYQALALAVIAGIFAVPAAVAVDYLDRKYGDHKL